MKHNFLPLIIGGLIIAGCSQSEGWNLNGEAPDGIETVYLQAPNNIGKWYTLDSAKVENGKYTFSRPRANSQIYALKLGEQTIYIPADSTETISVSSDGIRSGSFEAEMFNNVEKTINNGGSGRDVLKTLDGKYSSTAAYYATRLLKDRTLLRTVTNRYAEDFPNDPRTSVLKSELQKMMPRQTGEVQQQIIYADEIGYYDIELMDRNGNMQKLSETVEANPLTILAYVDFESEDCPAITRALGDANSAGAAIYEVGFAENQHIWSVASEGIPWIVVYQSDAANHNHIGSYAVSSLPTFFIIKNGEIIDRINDYSQLSKTLNSHK